MKHISSLLMASAAFVFITAHPALAASPNKGKKIDALLEKAIEDSAQEAMMMEEEPEALETVEAEEEPEPVMEEMAEEEPKPVEMAEDDTPTEPGFSLWGWRLIPSVALEGRYDSNIYAAPSNERDDFAYVVRPGLELTLEDSVHEMSFSADFEGIRYLDYGSEDEDNYHARFKGILDGGDYLTFPYDVAFAIDHEDRADDLTRELPVNKVRTQTINTMFGMAYQPNKVGVALKGFYDRERFDDEMTAAAVPVIRRDADRMTWKGLARVFYDVNEDNTVYLDISHASREYERPVFQGVSFNGPYRDSDLDQIGGGFKTAFKDMLTATGYLGYLTQDFDNTSINDNDMFVAQLNLGWQLADSTMLKINYDRSSYEDDVVINPIIRTEGGAALEHTLMEKILLGVAGSYRQDDFDASTREDDILMGRLYADYDVSERFALGAEYRYTTRDSSSSTFDYDRQTALVRLSGRL